MLCHKELKKIIFLHLTVTNVIHNTLYCKPITSLSLTNQHINALIALCRKGNQQAQMEVYKRYYLAMYNTSLRIVKNNFEAEDIMQDSFLTAFTRLDKLKDNERFGAWLKRIVVNNSIGHYHKNQKMNTQDINEVLYKIEDDSSTELTDTSDVSMSHIKLVINSLKENYAIALNLHLIEGYDYEELAEIMNISHGNSRTLISRAKSQLRQVLATQIER